jgi:hypothetical protein
MLLFIFVNLRQGWGIFFCLSCFSCASNSFLSVRFSLIVVWIFRFSSVQRFSDLLGNDLACFAAFDFFLIARSALLGGN